METINWISSMKEFAERFAKVHGDERKEIATLLRAGLLSAAIHRVEVLTS